MSNRSESELQSPHPHSSFTLTQIRLDKLLIRNGLPNKRSAIQGATNTGSNTTPKQHAQKLIQLNQRRRRRRRIQHKTISILARFGLNAIVTLSLTLSGDDNKPLLTTAFGEGNNKGQLKIGSCSSRAISVKNCRHGPPSPTTSSPLKTISNDKNGSAPCGRCGNNSEGSYFKLGHLLPLNSTITQNTTYHIAQLSSHLDKARISQKVNGLTLMLHVIQTETIHDHRGRCQRVNDQQV